ncbi:hypothetical protein D3C79_392970 [compost metagenome]
MDLPFPCGEVHIANVDEGDGHPALHQRQHVLRRFAHQKNLLPIRRLMDHVDGFLQGEVTGLHAFRDHHVHQVLLYRIGGGIIVGHHHQIGAQRVGPGHPDLAMHQAVIDTGHQNIGHISAPPGNRLSGSRRAPG